MPEAIEARHPRLAQQTAKTVDVTTLSDSRTPQKQTSVVSKSALLRKKKVNEDHHGLEAGRPDISSSCGSEYTSTVEPRLAYRRLDLQGLACIGRSWHAGRN